MTVRFPRDLTFEAYLGRWVEITALAESRALRQVEPVTVTWGSPSEQAKALAPPATMDAVLNNTGGHWTPGNPMSDYFAYLQGRNVPTRLGLRVSRDTFTGRTHAGFWGNTETSDGWNHAGFNDSYAVTGGVGTHGVSAVGSFALSYLGDSYTDCQVAATGSWNMNVAGGNLEPLNLVLRYQSSGAMSGEHYLLRVAVTPAEVLSVTIFHTTGAISSTITVATLTPGANSYRAKFQAEGQTLRGKVYVAGPSNDPDINEPLDWQVFCHHERLTSGRPGIRTGVATGNTNIPVTVSYDDWVLTLMRHTGELTKLQPTWDESHRHKRASIKCADITQRLGRPQRAALSSAPRRYLLSNIDFPAVDFWPLDELASAPTPGLNAVPGGVAAQMLRDTSVSPPRGAVTWGLTDRVLTSVPAFVGINNGARLNLPTTASGLSSACSVSLAVSPSPDAECWVIFTLGGVDLFTFFLYRTGLYEFYGLNTGLGTLVLLSSGTLMADGGTQAGQWATLGATLYANGAGNIGYHLNIDGATLGLGNFNLGGSYAALSRVLLRSNGPSTGGQGDTRFSSVLVTSTPLYFTIAGSTQSVGSRIANVTRGWIGETAGARAYRLCAEEGVPFDYWGDLGATGAMGPQRPIPLLDQLVECAERDAAFLYAPRYTAGVALRPRRAMAGRAADATLSYSDGHVAPVFAPAADDRPTANLVRAERLNGGTYILEQTSGPMNTGDPGSSPDAVGVVPDDVRVNVDSDAQLPDVAGWTLALGTVAEVRFPKVVVNLAARELTTGVDPTLPARQVLNLRPGDRILITGMTAADVYRDLDQIVRGGVEILTNIRQHKATFNTAPYEKYRSGIYGDTGSRYNGAVTTLDAQLLVGVTGGRAVTVVSGQPWTTTAGHFPQDVLIGGERITLSGVSGAGPGQTVTISARAVNGVAKTHPAGTRIYLYQPVYYS